MSNKTLAAYKKIGLISHRVYKFDNYKDLKEKREYLLNLYKSVIVVKYGALSLNDLAMIAATSDDDNYKRLKLYPNDLIILTKENLSIKIDEERKLIRKLQIQKSKQTNTDMSTTNKKLVRWTEEDLSHLWDGTAEEVGKKLGRTAIAVTFQRSSFMKRNSDFVVPAKCQYKPRATATPSISPVKKLAKKTLGGKFRMTVDGKEIRLDNPPAKLTVGDIVIEF